MEVKILNEAGYKEALLGLSFSYKLEVSYTPNMCSNINKTRAEILAFSNGGHNKFLEQIQTWICIKAPMYWWKQFDTYRFCSKSSKSTMHTIMKRLLTKEDFTDNVTAESILFVNLLIGQKKFNRVIAELPMGYLQTRLVNVSYKTLQNIVAQREGHKVKEWDFFISEVLSNIKHPEFLRK